jgi:hypothetical protein
MIARVRVANRRACLSRLKVHSISARALYRSLSYEKTLRDYAAVVAIGCTLLWLRI